MSVREGLSERSGDSSVLFCVGEPLFGSLTNLDGVRKLRGACTNPVHDCSCFVRFEHQTSSACLNCHGLCPSFAHVSLMQLVSVLYLCHPKRRGRRVQSPWGRSPGLGMKNEIHRQHH